MAETDTSTTTPTEDKERKTVKVTTKREIKRLFVHCSASPNGRNNDATDINAWHKGRFRRKSKYKDTFNKELKYIGYHFVICIDGTIQTGRHLEEIGAHVYKNNKDSVGICMIGTDAFTPAQWTALKAHLKVLEGQFPDAKIHGHHEYANKACPGFDVPTWLAAGRKEEAKHILAPKPLAPEKVPIPKPRPEGLGSAAPKTSLVPKPRPK